MIPDPSAGDSARQSLGGASGDFWDRYASFIERRAIGVLLGAAVFAAAGGYLSSRLELKSDFGELLPKNAPALRELDRIQARMGGLTTVVVAIEGGDWQRRIDFTERVASALRAQIPADQLSYIDYKITDARAHFERHKYLYVDFEDLVALRDRLKRKIEDVRRRKLVIDFDNTPPYDFNIDDIRRKYEAKAKDYDHFPRGYFVTPDKSLQALLLRLPSSGIAEISTDELVQKVRRIAESTLGAQEYRIRIGGDPVTSLEERQGIIEDILIVSIASILLIIFSIVLYYRSLRSLFIVAAPVTVGVAVSFGLADLLIGSLNSNTAFLGSIIAGNGINFAIIFLARYVEDRRRGLSGHEALRVALRQTWIGTVTAALAASIAYGSLMVTDFRGFSQFGFIGGLGMIVCWLATFTVGPALVVALESRWPLKLRTTRALAPHAPGRISAFMRRHYGWIAALGLVITGASVVGAVGFYRDPFEYDFQKLRSRRAAQTGSSKLGARVDTIFHGTKFMAGSPSLILVDRPDQVPALVASLKALKKEGAKLGRIESIHDLLPKETERKIPVLNEIRELLDKKALGWMTPEQRKQAEEYRPPDHLRPLGPTDLPAMLRRPFQEKDGRIGLLVYVYPVGDFFQGKQLLQFAATIREIKLANGETIRTGAREIVLADILAAVLDDGPIATLASFIGVLLLVTFAFRRFRDRFTVLLALVGGVIWMCGAAAALGIKVNMLNFVALPITFGIGVDYPVNVFRRYEEEGPLEMGRALWATGGAVALCSLTTVIGYSSLLFADTRALNSFGLAAVVGEVTTLLAALIWMPALVHIIDRRRFERAEAERIAAESGSQESSP
jgi:hypothetical protein